MKIVNTKTSQNIKNKVDLFLTQMLSIN